MLLCYQKIKIHDMMVQPNSIGFISFDVCQVKQIRQDPCQEKIKHRLMNLG